MWSLSPDLKWRPVSLQVSFIIHVYNDLASNLISAAQRSMHELYLCQYLIDHGVATAASLIVRE